MTQNSDVLILGGGSGGYACALRAAQLGKTVTLIEADKVGGTCLHRGCIPTKALMHAASIADTIGHARSIGISTTLEGIDIQAVHRYQSGIVDGLHQGLRSLIQGRRIELVEGTGRYVGDTTVAVGDRRYTGAHMLLATGSRARNLPWLPIGGRILTSDQALNHPQLPRRAIVLGGGVIGVEFASIWSSFGADVTMIEALPRLIAGEDEWLSKHLARAFGKRGIDVRTDTRVAAAHDSSSQVTVTLDSGEALHADLLLVATGREPRTAGAGFEEHGVVVDSRGFVQVDEKLRTTVENVYAAGDITPGPQLAHRGFQQGTFVAETLAGLDPVPVEDVNIPRVVYSAPEIASVGLTESQARERYPDVQTVIYDFAGNAKSQILQTAGAMKLVRAVDGPVVGVHMFGERVGELIGEAQLIVNWGAFPEDVAGMMHAHPTQNEALGEAAMALAGRPLHAHR